MPISRIFNFLSRKIGQMLSLFRKLRIQLAYPNCVFGRGVIIGSNVTIMVTDGGTCEIGDDTTIKANATIIVKAGHLRIGSNSFVGWGTVICANELIEIGADALIAENVSIRDQNHGMNLLKLPFRSQPMTTKPIEIESNVWIGAKATILPGIKIAESAVVGANAVVTKDIESKTIVGGVPAKMIRRL